MDPRTVLYVIAFVLFVLAGAHVGRSRLNYSAIALACGLLIVTAS